MGVCAARSGRGGSFALVCLSGLLASCSSAGLQPPGSTARAAIASDRIEMVDNFGAADLEQRFEKVARQVSPTVVAISATEAAVPTDASLGSDDISSDKLSTLLETVDRTVGTGFVIDSEGYIVTNDHVVATARQLWITTDAHKIYPAIVVGSDPRADLAVLKIPAHNLPVARFARGASHRGQWTIAIGNPYGLAAAGDMSVSVGVVSATNRSLPHLSGKEDRLYSDLVQTTAQINPGNSGGPLFNLSGDVIGINTAVILPQKQTNGIGFAIPADAHVLRLIENLKQGREVAYGFLGVRVTSPTPRQRREAGLSEDGGARIDSIEAGSPAAAAHLRVGDIISQLDGEAIRDTEDFVRLVGLCPVDEPLKAVIYRDGPRTVKLKLHSRPPALLQAAVQDKERLRWRGLLVGPLPDGWDFGTAKRPSSGVMVIGIDSRSPFIADGIKAGSVITSVAGKVVRDVADLQKIITANPARQCRLELANPTTAVVSARESAD
jgi:serine protease Do